MDLSNDEIYKQKLLFVDVARQICPCWSVSPENRDAVNAVFQWCLGIDGPLDPSKGLWLCGMIGTGKSTLLRIVKEFCRSICKLDMDGNLYGFRISNVIDVCGKYQKDGMSGIDEYCLLKRQAFDELGAEALVTGYYGTPLDVMGHVLMARYDRRYENFTHVTTNLTMQDVKTRYDERVYDRCREMFNFVELNGRSYRGINN